MPTTPTDRHPLRLVCLTLAAAALAGCQSANPALVRSEKATDLLVNTRQGMVAREQTVADSQSALRTLQASKGDLRLPFKAYVDALHAVQKQAELTRAESEAVKAQSAAYCAGRQGDVATISDDGLRTAALQRTDVAREKCDEIKDRYAKVNEDFGKYIRRLTDLQTYLANELNNGTLLSGEKWIDESLVSGEMLRKDIRDLAFQVELISNMLSPVPLAMTQWTTQLQPPQAIAAAGK